jgi:predicted O-methyltransferase YrrM
MIIRKYVFLGSCPNYNITTEMNFFSASKYLKYIVLSRHKWGHGIHSPFIFDLVSRIFRNKTDGDIVCRVRNVRKRMISDRRSVNVKDLGAGSDKFKTNLRKVSDIARYSPVPEKYGVLLSNLASEFGKPLILELGTSLGISTMYLAASCNDTIVYTIEGSPEIAEIAEENFNRAGFTNIKLLTGSFDEMLPYVADTGIKPGLVFIDGDHRKAPLLKYFVRLAELSDKKTVIVIDDIYYSREMEEAWNEIKINERVSVTVDIFRMGIVFFRDGINPNDYTIRY